MQEVGLRQHLAAWVEKGELKVEHGAGEPYPVVAPCRGARLFVNGKEFITAVAGSKSEADSFARAEKTEAGNTFSQNGNYVKMVKAGSIKAQAQSFPRHKGTK
ncbi:MAG: hypothetical protein K6U04_15875 [Armatimonadetes bacterium]|nr:hypothetical protein [Armatimonadota bacterium]